MLSEKRFSAHNMKRWTCTVPLMVSAGQGPKRALHAKRLKAMDADRVFLVAADVIKDAPPTTREWAGLRDALREGKAYFERQGFSVGFWMGRTIGHGEVPTDRNLWPFQPLVGSGGDEVQGCFCPLDERFRRYLREGLATMAGSGVEIIVLDDDFRMQSHGGKARFACFCPLHLEAFRRRSGQKLSAKALAKLALTGRATEARRQWLDTQGEGLMLLAADIEKAVHAVNPKTRIGLCSAMWLTSGLDGVDLPALLRTLAGPTRPFLRTIGAPYWDRAPSHVGWITEYSRLQAAWMVGQGFEIIAEGDTFPHNRYHTSATMLAAHQEFLMAAGFQGVLSYALGYLDDPDHDAGYWHTIAAARGHSKAVLDFFPTDYQDLGVRPIEPVNSFGSWPMPPEPGAGNWLNQPVSVNYLSRLGIPMAYGGDGGPAFISGWSASGLSDAELERAVAHGAFVDAVAARWLAERGFDVGVRAIEEAPAPSVEEFTDRQMSGRHAGIRIPPRVQGEHTFFRCRPARDVRILSRFLGPNGRELYPGTMLHEDAQGRRWCLLPLGLHDLGPTRGMSMLMFDYARQEQLSRAFAWINRRPLAATVSDAPDVHVMCRISPDGGRLVVAVQNAHLDPLENPTLRLDRAVKVGRQIELLTPDAAQPVRSSAFTYRQDKQYGYLTVHCTVRSMGMLSVALPVRRLQPDIILNDRLSNEALKKATGAAHTGNGEATS